MKAPISAMVSQTQLTLLGELTGLMIVMAIGVGIGMSTHAAIAGNPWQGWGCTATQQGDAEPATCNGATGRIKTADQGFRGRLAVRNSEVRLGDLMLVGVVGQANGSLQNFTACCGQCGQSACVWTPSLAMVEVGAGEFNVTMSAFSGRLDVAFVVVRAA